MNRFICTTCDATFPLTEHLWRCPCGGLLDIEFTPAFPLDRITGRKLTLWRYREAIPIFNDENIVTLDEGFTPLTKMEFEGFPVLVKQEHLFPTGSFKDRGAAVLLSRVKEEGVGVIVEDSSGNAGCALGAYAAAAGVECRLFVPAHASGAKLAQIRAYGAPLTLVEGPRENAARAAQEAARDTYYASHAANPFFHQGTKTFAYEVCEQLGWQAPDTVVLPAGNGTLLLGAQIGFSDLLRTGIIFRMPRLVAVQAAQCAPLHEAFWKGADAVASRAWERTRAEGIAVARPIRGAQILKAVRDTGGEILAVGEDDIAEAHGDMARRGFFIEPTAAATIAGLKKYLRTGRKGEVIVSVLTGHGLKGG